MRHRTVIALGAGVLVVIVPVGCQLAAKRDGPATPPAGVLGILEELPASGPVVAEDFALLSPREVVYELLDDAGAVQGRCRVTREATDQFGASIRDRRDDGHTFILKYDAEQNVVMPAELNSPDNALSRFDPPLVIAFARLEPNIDRKSESAMKVLELKNATRVRQTGKAVRTMLYRCDQRVRTPLGEFVAKRIEVQFVATLNLARAEERSIMYVVPGMGVIAEDSVEQRQVLGVFGQTRRRVAVLAKRARKDKSEDTTLK
jgi:hypothetical protein